MGIYNKKLADSNISAQQYFADIEKQEKFREYAAILVGRAVENPTNENLGNLLVFSLGSEKFLGHVEPNALMAIMGLRGSMYFESSVLKNTVSKAIEAFEGEPEGYMLSALRTYAIANREFQKNNEGTLIECLQKRNSAQARVEKFKAKEERSSFGKMKRVYKAKLEGAKEVYETEDKKLGRIYDVVEEGFALAESAYAKRGEAKRGRSVDGVVAKLIHNNVSGVTPVFYDVESICTLEKVPNSQIKSKELVDSLMSPLSADLHDFNEFNEREVVSLKIQGIIDEGAEIYKSELKKELELARAHKTASATEPNIFSQANGGSDDVHASVQSRVVSDEDVADIMSQLDSLPLDKGIID